MKIVDRKTFLAMPENTVFSEWEMCIFGPLMIKGESLTNDFFQQEIADAVDSESSEDLVKQCEYAAATGFSIGMNFDVQGRNGLYHDGQMFAVWEPEDVSALIERLKECLPNTNREG